MRPTRRELSRTGASRLALDMPALVLALRAPDPGLLRQGLRFALAGGTVAVIYLTTTTVLADVAGVPFQAALAIGFCAGLVVHFTLQRRFVWAHRDEFALPLSHQVGRYLAVAIAQYGVTAASTSLLPAVLDLPTEVVYLATATVLVSANFIVFRHGVFHAKPAVLEPSREPPALRDGERAGSSPLRRIPARLPLTVIRDLAIATLAVLLVASPLLFTGNGFAADFTNDIWLSAYQQHAIAAHLHPTLFLQSQQLGVFNPFFVFYGGTLFALTGALAVVLGGATIAAFELVTLATIAAAYGGIFWLARQLGVRGLMAHAPALVFVTSAYYITDLYGRGAWPEFMAVSMLPLVLACALRVVRGRRRVAPAVCLVAASTVFSGSHNITLLLGTTLTLGALAGCWLLSGHALDLPWRRMLAAAGLIALGVGLNGWTLLPDLRYARDTLISAEEIPWSATGAFNAAGVIFDPLRTVPSSSETPALFVQIPVLALIWSLIALPLVWRERRLRAGAATALIVLGGLLALIMSPAAYTALPTIYKEIQFPYRLQTYVTLACAGLVLLGALALTRRAESGRAARADRGLKLGLGLAVACGVALSVWQLWVPNTQIHQGWYSSYSNRAEVLAGPPTLLPRSWNARNNYGDRTLPLLAAASRLTFNAAQVQDDRLVGLARATSFPPGGQPVATNIAGGPYLVHVGGGVRVVGRTPEGDLVIRRATTGSQPVPIELSAQDSAPVALGRIITAAAALALLALAATAVVRRRKLRAAKRSPQAAPHS